MPQYRLLQLALLSVFAVSAGSPGQASDSAERASQAAQAMRTGNFSLAARMYRELAAQYPADANLGLSLATALYSARQYPDALRELTAVRLGQHGNAKFWLLLAETELKLAQQNKAIEALTHAVELDPEDDATRLELASTQLELRRLAAAEKQYQLLANKLPQSSKVWRGLAWSQFGLSSEALDSLKTQAPHSSYLYGLAAAGAAESGDKDKASKLYQKALALSPGADWMRTELASVQQEAPGPPCTAKTFACRYVHGELRALAAEASKLHTPEAFYWTTRAYAQLARQSMETLNSLPPSSDQHELAALLYAQSGQRAEAISEFREAVKLNPGDQPATAELAEELWADRQYDESIKLLTGLIAATPDRADWQFELGDALFNSGQPEDSIAHLNKAIELSPGLLPAHAKLGEALLRTANAAEAVPHLERAQSIDRDGSIHFQLAAAYRKLGRPDAAAKAMERQKELAAAATPKAE